MHTTYTFYTAQCVNQIVTFQCHCQLKFRKTSKYFPLNFHSLRLWLFHHHNVLCYVTREENDFAALSRSCIFFHALHYGSNINNLLYLVCNMSTLMISGHFS